MTTASTNYDLPDNSSQQLVHFSFSDSTSGEIKLASTPLSDSTSAEIKLTSTSLSDSTSGEIKLASTSLSDSMSGEIKLVSTPLSDITPAEIKLASTSLSDSTSDEIKLIVSPLSDSTSGEIKSSHKIKFPITNNSDVENDVAVKCEIQHLCQYDYAPVCGFQRYSDKMKVGPCDDGENEGNHLHPGTQMCTKEVSRCQEDQSSIKLTDPFDLLSEEEPSHGKYQPVRRKMLHVNDNLEEDLHGCAEDKNQSLVSRVQHLGKAANEGQNCQSSRNLTDRFSVSTDDGLSHQHGKKTLFQAGDTIKAGLSNCSMVEVIPSLLYSPNCNKKESEQKENPPADSSDPVSLSTNEDLFQRECQYIQKPLLNTDDTVKTILYDSDKVEIPCIGSEKKDNQPVFYSIDPHVFPSDHFDLSSNEGLLQRESQYSRTTVLHTGDAIKTSLYTRDKVTNCNKGGNENNHQSADASDPSHLSVEEDKLQNDYQTVKMKLLELKHKFDEAVCNSDLDRCLPPLTYVHPDEKIKLTQEDKSLEKTDDPFDLSPEDDLFPEKYQPLKRKFCKDSKNCNENKNSNLTNDLGMVGGATLAALPQTGAGMQKAPDNKRLKAAYRVAYVHSQELLEKANDLIRIKGRADLVHSLITSFGLLQYLQVVSPRCATDMEIVGFHCPDYVSVLRGADAALDSDDSHSSDADSYGLSYDCPLQKGIFETCSLISGATIVAAETLINNTADVAINWYGGWHHAKRDSAAGFCYINDIVLGILKLREKFDRILYVDIDLHHGDGVEEAFCMTPKVMTVSFHKYMFGFFPGSGSVEDVGTGKGKYYCVNVPLLDGIKDAEFCAVFYSVMKLVREKFQPQVIVLQCGADTLSSDPMTSFNLTHLGVSRCVGFMLSWNLPTMLLGGGGYNFPNTAKCWSFLTSLAAGKKLPLDIPEHEHLSAYGPDFEMSTAAGYRKDCNTRQHLANLVAKISRNLSSI